MIVVVFGVVGGFGIGRVIVGWYGEEVGCSFGWVCGLRVPVFDQDATGTRHGVDGNLSRHVLLSLCLDEHLYDVGVGGSEFDGGSDDIGDPSRDDSSAGRSPDLVPADGDGIGSGLCVDPDVVSGLHGEWCSESLVPAEQYDFGSLQLSQVDQRPSWGIDFVECEQVADRFASDGRVEFVSGPKCSEGSVLQFVALPECASTAAVWALAFDGLLVMSAVDGVAGDEWFEQLAEQQLRGGIFESTQCGECIDSEGALVASGFGECIGTGVVIEVGECAGGVETDFEFRLIQSGLEERDRLGPDGFECQGGLSSGLGRFEVTGELLHADLSSHIVFANRDLADDSQESREVVPVPGVNLEHDGAVCFWAGQRFADPMPVVGIESSADPVRDPSCHSDAAVPILEGDHQVASFSRSTATGDSSAAEDTRKISAVTLAMRNQHVAFGTSKNVSGQDFLARHDGSFGEIGFHEPASVEAGGFASGWKSDFNVKAIALANQRRQVGSDDDQCGRG